MQIFCGFILKEEKKKEEKLKEGLWKREFLSSNDTLLNRKPVNNQIEAVFENVCPTSIAFVSHFTHESYLVPAFQGPFPLLQHKPLVFIRPLDVALTNFQPLDYLPAVCLLEKKWKYAAVSELIHLFLQNKKENPNALSV